MPSPWQSRVRMRSEPSRSLRPARSPPPRLRTGSRARARARNWAMNRASPCSPRVVAALTPCAPVVHPAPAPSGHSTLQDVDVSSADVAKTPTKNARGTQSVYVEGATPNPTTMTTTTVFPSALILPSAPALEPPTAAAASELHAAHLQPQHRARRLRRLYHIRIGRRHPMPVMASAVAESAATTIAIFAKLERADRRFTQDFLHFYFRYVVPLLAAYVIIVAAIWAHILFK